MTSIFKGPLGSLLLSQCSLSEELHFNNGPKEKLKVDEEDLLNDAITYYPRDLELLFTVASLQLIQVVLCITSIPNRLL